MSHPNIYSLYQVVETDTSFYLIVEYLPGGELFDYILQKGSLGEPEARSIFRELVSAIGYAHQKGVAHRDLKPLAELICWRFNEVFKVSFWRRIWSPTVYGLDHCEQLFDSWSAYPWIYSMRRFRQTSPDVDDVRIRGHLGRSSEPRPAVGIGEFPR
ncbi:unnamed protein product [Dibothriocephalus latus]|uniref:Protein kinase domain-containing protein n=1 Tax=Dibothriocephalus latus TaxID=60516 RepID=A0A3P7M106_DIBLA|nr:unnamed protein product [Dibothriocephalus latus]